MGQPVLPEPDGCCMPKALLLLDQSPHRPEANHLSQGQGPYVKCDSRRSNPQSDQVPEFTCTTPTHMSYKGHGGQEGADPTGLGSLSGETSGSTLASSHTHTKMLT